MYLVSRLNCNTIWWSPSKQVSSLESAPVFTGINEAVVFYKKYLHVMKLEGADHLTVISTYAFNLKKKEHK
jgi:hypothetical protein